MNRTPAAIRTAWVLPRTPNEPTTRLLCERGVGTPTSGEIVALNSGSDEVIADATGARAGEPPNTVRLGGGGRVTPHHPGAAFLSRIHEIEKQYRLDV